MTKMAMKPDARYGGAHRRWAPIEENPSLLTMTRKNIGIAAKDMLPFVVVKLGIAVKVRFAAKNMIARI